MPFVGAVLLPDVAMHFDGDVNGGKRELSRTLRSNAPKNAAGP